MYDFSLKRHIRHLGQLPHLQKIILRVNVRSPEELPTAFMGLHLVSGQYPRILYAKKAVAGFQTRKGQALGCGVTLQGLKMEAFLNIFINVVLPKLSEFKGFNTKNLDQHGNLHFGVDQFLLWPQCEPYYEFFQKAGGFHGSLICSTDDLKEAILLYTNLHLPIRDKISE